MSNQGDDQYQIVNFHNGTDHSLNLVWNKTSYGTAPAHSTVSIPRFVAKYFASRNLLYKLVDDSPEAAAIESEKEQISGAEVLHQNATKEQERDVQETAKKVAEHAKAQAEEVLSKSEGLTPLATPASAPEVVTPTEKVDTKK